MEKRFPCVAGTFYPAEKEKLKNIIEGFLNEISLPQIKGKIFGILSPHAGYIYSGKVAACSFKSIALRKIERVILIGVSHQKIFEGISLWKKGSWITPLGEVLVDERFKELVDEKIEVDMLSHSNEYCIEIFLPILQHLFGNDIKIIPFLVKDENSVEDLLEVAERVGNFLKKNEDFKLITTFNLFKGINCISD